MLRELRKVDAVHVRCPANIPLLAIILLALRRKPGLRWVKYAGNWTPTGSEPIASRFQRWWLDCGFHRGLVTVNGNWPGQPSHVHSFLNPCLTDSELDDGVIAAGKKVLCHPVQLVFVGRLESAKGAGICLELLAQLQRKGIQAELDLVGDGEERVALEEMARKLGIATVARFHGGVPRTGLGTYYSRAHFIVLPSKSEGWPKVLSEAMAYGVVPVASAVSSIPQVLQAAATGQTVRVREASAFCDALESYLKAPTRWGEHSKNAVEAARQFSYSAYLQAVAALLDLQTGVCLAGSQGHESVRC
jgi:glycosyltransferase involved in cell wall biosynthesis